MYDRVFTTRMRDRQVYRPHLCGEIEVTRRLIKRTPKRGTEKASKNAESAVKACKSHTSRNLVSNHYPYPLSRPCDMTTVLVLPQTLAPCTSIRGAKFARPPLLTILDSTHAVNKRPRKPTRCLNCVRKATGRSASSSPVQPPDW